MLENKEKIIIKVLIGIIILGAILFGVLLRAEKAKTAAFTQNNFGKGLDGVSVQVKIKEETPEGQYNDSLYYTADDWATKTPADIEVDKKVRVDKWLATVRNPGGE